MCTTLPVIQLDVAKPQLCLGFLLGLAVTTWKCEPHAKLILFRAVCDFSPSSDICLVLTTGLLWVPKCSMTCNFSCVPNLIYVSQGMMMSYFCFADDKPICQKMISAFLLACSLVRFSSFVWTGVFLQGTVEEITGITCLLCCCCP